MKYNSFFYVAVDPTINRSKFLQGKIWSLMLSIKASPYFLSCLSRSRQKHDRVTSPYAHRAIIKHVAFGRTKFWIR